MINCMNNVEFVPNIRKCKKNSVDPAQSLQENKDIIEKAINNQFVVS